MSGYSQRHSLGREAGQDVYRQIFKATANGIFVLEADASQCTVVDVNPAFEALTGITAIDCIGRCLRAADPPGQFIAEFAECMQCIATGDPLERDCQVGAARGPRSLRLRLMPLREPGRNVTRIVGELRDLSESERIAAGFYERAAQFQALVENAPDFIGRYTVEGHWLYMNPALERASGFRLEQVRGRLISETMPDSATTRRFRMALAEAVRNRAVVEIELQSDAFIRGETMWHHVQIVPEFDGDDNVVSVIAIGRDITEKRRAAELSRELAEQFRDLVENAPDAIARYDAEGRFQYINPALERLAGHTLDQVRGKLYEEVTLTLPGAEQFFQTLRDVIAHGTPLEMEFYIAPRSGDPVWHQLRFVPEFDQAQRVTTVLVVGRDITRIKRAEEQLRRREQEYRTLAENSPDFISRFSPDGNFLYVNPTVLRSNGLTLAELQSMIPPPGADRIRRGVAEAVKTRVPLEIEIQLPPMYAFQPEPVWHLTRFVPEFDQNGEVMSVLCIGRDITQLKQTEAKLRQREREFRTLAENYPNVISRMDRNLRCVYINPAVTRLSGIPAERFIGTLVGELAIEHGGWAMAETLRLREACKRAFESGVIQQEEIAFADGRVVEFQLVPEHGDDEILSVMSIGRDITEIRRSEAAMKQLNAVLEERVAARTIELEQANRELEKFGYTVSHDLRAPLRVINGFVDILLEQEQAQLTEDGRRMLVHISAAGTKLGKLIADILEYSRLGHAPLRRQRVDMAALVREIVASLQPDYPRTQVAIGDLPDAFGDPTMLHQVVQNLVNNAFKFSARQSEPCVTIGVRAGDEQTIYRVNDNGVGFDMHYADKLFGVFQRLHSDSEFPGTGAGLAIVKRLVERHGGRIWVESAPGAGTTFFFTL